MPQPSEGQRRRLLVAALGFALLDLHPEPPALTALRGWLDSWTGLGIVVDGMTRQGFDLALTRHGDAEPAWAGAVLPRLLPPRRPCGVRMG